LRLGVRAGETADRLVTPVPPTVGRTPPVLGSMEMDGLRVEGESGRDEGAGTGAGGGASWEGEGRARG
jgi:hypothetical protein